MRDRQFEEYLKRTSAEAATWPVWKQNLLGGPPMNPDYANKHNNVEPQVQPKTLAEVAKELVAIWETYNDTAREIAAKQRAHAGLGEVLRTLKQDFATAAAKERKTNVALIAGDSVITINTSGQIQVLEIVR